MSCCTQTDSEKRADWKKKVQHQSWVASESPDPSFDLTDCGLSEIPAGVFSTCKVCSKDALILSTNFLKSLTDNNNQLSLLANLKVLDIRENKFVKLPKEISQLTQLQVLNVSCNNLKSLPDEITELTNLQTLNMEDNVIGRLPVKIGKLTSLRSLNVRKNLITKLPSNIAYCRALENLNLDVFKMRSPDKETCENGLQAIMKQLCEVVGISYIPPSKGVIPLLKCEKNVDPRLVDMDPDNIQESLCNYEESKRRKQAELLMKERARLDNVEQFDKLSQTKQSRRADNINNIEQEMAVYDFNMDLLRSRQDKNRRALLQAILQDDERCTLQINEIINRNLNSNKTKELYQQLEDDRMSELAQLTLKQEELLAVRRQEMLEQMRLALLEMQAMDRGLSEYHSKKRENIFNVQQSQLMEERELENRLDLINAEKGRGLDELLHEEKFQRMALESLMRQRDERHCQLTDDIQMLESQLAKLTIVEMNNKISRNQQHNLALEEQRATLAQLLWTLMEEREKRAKMIAERLVEMELAREEENADFWLAQLQRLMERKPDALIKRETELEVEVLDILNMSEADEYRPHFARHKITLTTLKDITDQQLRQIGVEEVGLRRTILNSTQSYITKHQLDTNDKLATNGKLATEEEGAAALPAAPSSQPSDDIIAHVTQECVICLDKPTNIVFVPCGHVCTCMNCSQPLLNCPMCRANIEHKIILDNRTNA